MGLGGRDCVGRGTRPVEGPMELYKGKCSKQKWEVKLRSRF